MLFIDYKSGLPIYEQVYNGILRLADIGALKPGDQLPSVRAVASEAGVNPNTVQKAYTMLERDGVIRSVPGRGSFLAEHAQLADSRRRAALENLGKAVEEAVRAGAFWASWVQTARGRARCCAFFPAFTGRTTARR